MTTFNTVEAAIASIARGGMVIVVDDADRENEGSMRIRSRRDAGHEALANGSRN